VRAGGGQRGTLGPVWGLHGPSDHHPALPHGSQGPGQHMGSPGKSSATLCSVVWTLQCLQMNPRAFVDTWQHTKDLAAPHMYSSGAGQHSHIVVLHILPTCSRGCVVARTSISLCKDSVHLQRVGKGNRWSTPLQALSFLCCCCCVYCCDAVPQNCRAVEPKYLPTSWRLTAAAQAATPHP
jgi:hypothetical protein